MKMQSYTLLFILFIAILIGSTCNATAQPVKTPLSANQNFTTADATVAYNAFNKAFYDASAKLYYSTTKRDKLAAIWTQAVYWNMAMDVYNRAKDQSQLSLIKDIYQGGYNQYDGYNWNNHVKWFIYDDMMWWIMSLTRAYGITDNKIYLQQAIAGFNHVWEGSYDAVDGGMYWDFKHSGKNACINYPTVIAAMRLYKITSEASYLAKAKSIYAWSRANIFDVTKGRIADNKIGNHKPGFGDYTYNQGTAIGAAVLLYKSTKDAAYLADAKLIADYTMNSMCVNGILPAEGDWNEQGVLKAIFAQYIMQLINECGQKQYLAWIQKNINTGWGNRDVNRNLTFRNYSISCPTGQIQSYEASSIVTFMQICKPAK